MNEKEELQHTEHVDEKSHPLDDDCTESNDKNKPALVKYPEEAAFLRKLNWTLLPLIFLIIFIQVIPKVFHRLYEIVINFCIVLRQIRIDCSRRAWYIGRHRHEWYSIQLVRLSILFGLLGLSGKLSYGCTHRYTARICMI